MTIEVRETGWGIPYINAAGDEYDDAVRPAIDHVGREIARWVKDVQGGKRGRANLIDRNAYVTPSNPYSQMAVARAAVQDDDIVGGVCDVTEGLGLQGVKWEADEPVDADLFNQLARDLNIDGFVRQWHREMFTYSQVVVGMWWGRRDYRFRGKSAKGRKSRVARAITAPVALTYLDPMKVVPLKPGPFGQDRLAWAADDAEWEAATIEGAPRDAVLEEFTVGPIRGLPRAEKELITSWGKDPDRLLLLNPGAVFRVTATKASYDRFPDLRLKSVFPLLDLKSQLVEADRVSLVGAINFILLVRQGDKDKPATQDEIDNLRENFKVVAKLPVVIGDHRLSIDIIMPAQDQVLQSSKYDTIDRRILSRTLGALSMNAGERGSATLTRGIARLLENRRHMMKRALEEQVARAVVEHPANANAFEGEPNLAFTPRSIQLESDAELARTIMSLRDHNEISRETTLEYFGFDQAVEAVRREFEAGDSGYDDTFQTRVPFSSPDLDNGRPPGGGESPKSVDGQVRDRTPSGQPKT